MARFKYNDDDIETEIFLADGQEWSDAVLDGMENANWHTARSAFSKLIRLLPEVYLNLPHDLQVDLQRAVDAWDREF